MLDPRRVALRWTRRLALHRHGFTLATNSERGNRSSHPDGHGAWQTAPWFLPALLICIPLLILPTFSRNHAFVVIEVPGPDPTVEQIAKLLRDRPLRVRITIRQLMIAVAISALSWISLEVFRSTRASQFKLVARVHADLEDIYRGHDATKADYHAAMRRKYEQAAASRSFSVAPDPRAPP